MTSLSTTTLAEAVGLTSGALFRHFSSRDEILEEAVRYAVEKIEATFPDPSLEPRQRLLQLARNRVRLLGSDRGLAWLLRSDQAYLALPEAGVEQLRDLVKRSQRYLLGAVREGAERGTIRSDIEPESLVVMVMGTVQALIGITGVHRQEKPTHKRDAERVLSALERMLVPPDSGTRAKTKSKKRGHKTGGKA